MPIGGFPLFERGVIETGAVAKREVEATVACRTGICPELICLVRDCHEDILAVWRTPVPLLCLIKYVIPEGFVFGNLGVYDSPRYRERVNRIAVKRASQMRRPFGVNRSGTEPS